MTMKYCLFNIYIDLVTSGIRKFFLKQFFPKNRNLQPRKMLFFSKRFMVFMTDQASLLKVQCNTGYLT